MSDDKARVVDLTDFIDHAIALADSLEEDIKRGDKYTTETVLRLSKFVTVAEPVMTAMAAAIPDKNTLQ